MSANRRQWSVAALAAVAVAAAIAPWLGTGAVATAAEPDASFAESVVYEETGDVANVTVETDEPATVNVVSRNGVFRLRVAVTEGTTTLRLNTYKAGASDRYSVSEMVWAAEDSDGSIRSRRLVTDPIDAPLDPAQYDVNVTVGGVEQDLATLWLQERTTDDITARIAPRDVDVSELSSGADVAEVSKPPWNDSIARGDWLLLHVDASGVNGAVAKSLLDGDVMRVEFEQTNPPMNGQGNEFTGDAAERLFTHPDSEGFYLAVDTADHGVEPGDRYRASFVVPADSPLADAQQNASTEIRVVERRVELDQSGPRDTVVVDGETRISGTTTLTPGTTINLTARDPGVAPLFETREVEVSDDRTFSTTFDFSDLDPGREFEFRLRDQSKIVPAVVAGATTTEPTTTAEPTTTTVPTTTSPPTTAPDPTTTDDPTETTAATTTAEGLTQLAVDGADRALTQQALRDEADEGGVGPVPGFDPLAALLALAAALVLAVRRL